VQIKACTNYNPKGSELATRGETIFTRIYWKESFKMKHLIPISIKLGTNRSCMKGIQVYLNEGLSPLERRIITKVHE
jgi:hypothetical protein